MGFLLMVISYRSQTDLYHCGRSLGRSRLVLRPSRHAVALRLRLHVRHCRRFHHDHRGFRPRRARSCVRRCFHRRLRHLSRLPRQRHLAVEQPFGLLQTSRRHGHSDRSRQPGWWYVLSLNKTSNRHEEVNDVCAAMASNFYRAKDSPTYRLGHALELGFVVLGLIAVILMRLGYTAINKKRDRAGVSTLSEAELSDLGDRAPTFRYVL